MPYAAFHPDCDVLTAPDAEVLARVGADPKVPGLMIFGYTFESLRELAPLSGHLQILKISGAPRLASLEGVQNLAKLQEVVLSTPTGSAGSGRCIAVRSFAPLERLPQLARLVLQGVRPEDLDLSPIMRMLQLQEVDIGGVPEFTIEHYARLAQALPHAKGRCLAPYVTIRGVGRCRKCHAQSVLLNGAAPRARKWVCPTCNARLLSAHVARWEQLTGRPYRAADGDLPVGTLDTPARYRPPN
jgi:hypothetical protein